MKNQRHNEIMRLLAENHMVRANELVDRFQVSMETIRRDFEYLEKCGNLTRVYGGAVIKSMHGLEPEYTIREIKNYHKKVEIGKAAAQLVKDGDTIIVDLGTTTLEFAKFLHDKKNLTIFTNSIQVASELVRNNNIKVIMLGGMLRSGELSTSGFLAEEMIDRFRVDKVFLGVGGFTLGFGIGDYHIEESNLRRHFVRNAQEVIALADSSKFGIKTLSNVCHTNDIDMLVTDEDTDKKLLTELKKSGIQVIVAEKIQKM